MSKDSLVLGSRLGSLQLGRYKGRLVNIFENPELGAHTVAVAETIRTVPEDTALEFQRTYDVGAISAVVVVPPLASLIFGIVWVRMYAHKDNADLQVIVATAFTVSSYIVTAGKTQDTSCLCSNALSSMLISMLHRWLDTCSHRFPGPEKGPE